MKYSSAAVVLGMSLCVAALPAAADVADPSRAVAAAAAEQLETRYVFPSRGAAAAALLRRNAAAGAYDGLRTTALGKRVTDDLEGVLHDAHVRLHYSVDVNPPAGGAHQPSAEEIAAQAQFDREIGYGLGRIAHLPGNVGYVDLRFFAGSPDETAAVLDAAATAVAYSDAVVLDLRRNHGGSPEAVARLLSHFLAPKTHLNDFLGRGDGDAKIVMSTSTSEVPGAHITAPLYVLISGETGSGAEECAYDIQSLKRGTLIGAVSRGAANPGGFARIDDHFSIFVPDARAQNPITKTNWEGVGVKPDVATPRERALATAYATALDARLRAVTIGTEERATLTALRAKLDAMADSEILAL